MHLINNSAELKANFSGVALNFLWPNISSFAEDVEMFIIAEAIGQEALDYFTGNLSTLTGLPKQALVLLQRSAAYLTIERWSQTALYQFEDKALYVAKSTGGAVISDKKLMNLREYCQEQGYQFLDKAIDLMERNLNLFPTYADAGVRQDLIKGFIKTAIEFSGIRNINSSRITFNSLHAIMLEVQDSRLPAYMSESYYQVYKEKYLDGQLSLDEQKLLPFIKKAVVMLTVAEACRQLPVQINGRGLFVNRYNNSMDYAMQDPASVAQVDFLQDDHREKGDQCLVKVENFLKENSAWFPGYAIAGAVIVPLNDECSGLFMM